MKNSYGEKELKLSDSVVGLFVSDMKQKMVVIIIESFNYMPEAMLKETLSLWADMNQMDDDDFIEELTEEGANDLLIQSAPPVLTANVDKNIIKFKKRYKAKFKI